MKIVPLYVGGRWGHLPDKLILLSPTLPRARTESVKNKTNPKQRADNKKRHYSKSEIQLPRPYRSTLSQQRPIIAPKSKPTSTELTLKNIPLPLVPTALCLVTLPPNSSTARPTPQPYLPSTSGTFTTMPQNFLKIIPLYTLRRKHYRIEILPQCSNDYLFSANRIPKHSLNFCWMKINSFSFNRKTCAFFMLQIILKGPKPSSICI